MDQADKAGLPALDVRAVVSRHVGQGHTSLQPGEVEADLRVVAAQIDWHGGWAAWPAVTGAELVANR